MCGLPGAGKTTLARRLADELPAVRLCPDEWMARLGVDLRDEGFRERLEVVFWSHAQELLRLRQSVILESGFWLRSDRDEKRLGARRLGAVAELRYLDTSSEELWRRLQLRNAESAWRDAPITRAEFDRWRRLFQAPDPQEMALFNAPAEAR